MHTIIHREQAYCSIVLAESTINFVANKMFSVFLPVPAMST